MKKLSIFFFFLFAISLYAQQEVLLQFITTDSTGQEHLIYVSDSSGVHYGYLPVKIMSGSLGNITIPISPATKEWADDSLTVTSEVDSIAAPSGSATLWSFDIIGVEDTLEFSLVSKSFEHPRRLFPNQSKYIKDLSVSDFPKVYIRRKGAYGACVYDFDSIGY